MGTHELFTDEPLRITCSGCGKEFYAEEIRRCRVCGGFFCSECQKTHVCGHTHTPAEVHDARTPAPEPAVSAAVIPADDNTSALIPAAQPEKVPYKNTGMYLTDDEAYSAYVRRVNPFITCESCGEEYPCSDIWVCPDCGAVLCQICRQKHKCPKPEGEQNKLLALLPFKKEKKEKKPARPAAYLPAAGQAQVQTPASAAHKTAAYSVSSAAAVSAASAASDIQYRQAEPQNLPAVRSAEKPVPAAAEMRTCDHCGKEYPVSKLKKCHSCGAVLCPKCRLLHSCSSKADASDEKITETAAAKKKKSASKTAAEPAVTDKIPAAEPKKKAAAQKTAGTPADTDSAAPKKKRTAKKTAADSAGEKASDAKASVPKKTSSSKKTAAQKKDSDELLICDGCGEPYLKSNLRKCRVCGAILCPKCRKKHSCGKKEE